MKFRAPFSRYRCRCLPTVLLGSLFLLVACGSDEKPKSAVRAKARVTVETQCKDGKDNDKDGKADCEDSDCQSPGGLCKAAPALDRTVASTLSETAAFLYTGDNPLQKEADPKAFDAKRVAMLKGKVVGDEGKPLAGVRVSVAGHKEYGYTLTRDDGVYDLAVNGGTALPLDYELDGHLPVQRAVTPGWQRYHYLANVGLIQANPLSSTVSAETLDPQTLSGPSASDSFGDREPMVIFQPNTVAEAVLTDGRKEELERLTVSVTEFPLKDAEQYLPGSPQLTGLSYGLDFSVAEAKELGATHVTFSKAVSLYVENFLELPVGTSLPLGYYDRKSSQWEPGKTGKVIEIIDVKDGKAVIDAEGDGKPADAATLKALGITKSDLEQLAQRFKPGTQLMQASVNHFSAHVVQVNLRAPRGATGPSGTAIHSFLEHPTRRGSILVEPRASVQELPITGTPYSLSYQSHRSTGYEAGFSFDLPVIPASVPPGLKRATARVAIAGKVFEATFDAKPNQNLPVNWDGFDSFNRLMQGPSLAEVTIAYVYDGVLPSGKKPKGGGEIVLQKTVEYPVGVWDYKGFELGGFGLNVLHSYSPGLRTVFYGYGDERSMDNVALVTKPACSDSNFNLGTPDSIVALADGSIIVSDDQQQDRNALGRLLRITPDGRTTVIAGPGASGEAARIALAQPQGVVALSDGSLVVADVLSQAIRHIDPQGRMTTLISGDEAEQPLATLEFEHLDGLALGSRQELYIVDGNQVLKYEGNAFEVVAGGGTETVDGALATESSLSKPSGIVVSPLGEVYIAERDGHRIRKVQVDGSLVTVAGLGSADFLGDGGLAKDAALSSPRGLALGPDGSLYVVDQGNNRIRRITPDGFIQTVIGGGTEELVDGRLATHVKLAEPDGIAMGRDGTLFIATLNNVLRVSPGLRELDEKEVLVPSEDGRTLFRFDHRGKHQSSIDALTGVTLLSLRYNDQGLLTGLVDENGLETTLERDGNGVPTRVIAPYGQVTHLDIPNGYAATVTDPIDRTYKMNWNATTGLLERVEYPGGQAGSFQYDVTGRLERVTDPTGYAESITGGPAFNGTSAVTVRSPSGKTTDYLAQALSTGGVSRSTRLANGAFTQWSEGPTTQTATYADGTKVSTFLMPDTAFGPQSMLPSESTVTLPSGRTHTSSYYYTKKVEDIANALSLQEYIEEADVDGRMYSTAYSRATRTLTSTSPMGRISTTTLDEAGRPVRMTAPGVATVDITYDDDGRVVGVRRSFDGKTRTEVRGYGDDGWVSSVSNPVGNTVSYTWDGVGRPKTVTRPDQQSISWVFDNANNVTSLTPPGKNAHRFEYDDSTKLLTVASPPSVDQPSATLSAGQKSYTYGPDQELTSITNSDGSNIGFTYNQVGQVTAQKFGKVTLSFGYNTGGHLSSINRSDSVKLDLSRDGATWTGTNWSGAVTGSVKATYDDFSWLASLTVNNQSTVHFDYDDDGLLIMANSTAGSMTLSRDPNTGVVTGTSIGNTETTSSYNGFGELSDMAASVFSAPLFDQHITRDDLGRVTHIAENGEMDTHELSYGYDDLGRLTSATRDGVTTTYGYDSNGNRVSVKIGDAPEVTATFDAQDRIVSYGPQTYEHSPAGHLKKRSDGEKTVELTYDELGNLTQAKLVDGNTQQTIDYVIDGFGRRVARKVDGKFDRSFLYRDELRPISEVDSSGTFTHFVYAESSSGAPDFMLRSGVVFRIIKDHVGSVRLVINAKTGEVAQSLEFDAFGRTLSDSNPGFQPFGFAGGLYDADTKLVRFGARDYDPGMGRWTNRDPIGFAGGDTNIYAYVGNNPVNLVDPDGLRPLTANERAFLSKYFGNSINLDVIDIGESMIGCSWAPTGSRIGLLSEYFVGNDSSNEVNLADAKAANRFSHEAIHVWQRQQGRNVSIPGIALGVLGSVGAINPYEFDPFQNVLPQFIKGTVEQQAEIFAYCIELEKRGIGNMLKGCASVFSQVQKQPMSRTSLPPIWTVFTW